jgi:DNA gyrase/topoisomerase IV subunit A
MLNPERYDSIIWNIVMMWLSVERDMNCVKQRKEHILEGLIIASDNIDEVIALIKSSKKVPEEARGKLIERFQIIRYSGKSYC